MQSQPKSQETFSEETDKLIFKFLWKCKRTRIVKTTLKNKVGRPEVPKFKAYYK
jgi:hypothetical protein